MIVRSGPGTVRLLLGITLAVTAVRGVCRGQDAATSPRESAEVVIAGETVALPEPILRGDEPADEQRERITNNLRGLSYQPFARDSVVAPVRIDLDYIKDSAGDRVGHRFHVMFIVHAPFSKFASDDFTAQVLGPSDTQESDDTFRSETLSDQALEHLGVDASDGGERFRRLTFDLLDKIRFSGVFRFQTTTGDGQNRVDLSLVDGAASRWRRLDDSDQTDREGDYSGLRGWITATDLATGDGVLIEARLAFYEPPQWFRGSNYLRSKLPLALQEAARDLRRRLDRE